MTTRFEVVPVDGARELHAFLALPRRIHSAPIGMYPLPRRTVARLIDPSKNPWFRHGDGIAFVAFNDGEPVGRIMAHVDRRRTHESSKPGAFGLFESIDDSRVARGLLEAAEDWLAAQHCTSVTGPVDPTAFISGGLLVSGFDEGNYVGTPASPPHYPRLIQDHGYLREMDLFSWRYGRFPIPKQVRQIARAVAQEPTLELHKIDLGRFERELDRIVDVYNASWRGGWGFVPIDREEMRAFLDNGRLVDPRMSFIATVDGKPAAIAIAAPNYNELRSSDQESLNPLRRVRSRVRRLISHPATFRQLLFGIKPEYRGNAVGGLGIHLYTEVLLASRAAGYREGEATWTLSVQEIVNGGLKVLGAEECKTYRIYKKDL